MGLLYFVRVGGGAIHYNMMGGGAMKVYMYSLLFSPLYLIRQGGCCNQMIVFAFWLNLSCLPITDSPINNMLQEQNKEGFKSMLLLIAGKCFYYLFPLLLSFQK